MSLDEISAALATARIRDHSEFMEQCICNWAEDYADDLLAVAEAATESLSDPAARPKLHKALVKLNGRRE